MKNKKILKILKSYKSSINVKDDWADREKLNAFVPTRKNLIMLNEFFEAICNRNSKSILLSGAYGTGKSYLASISLAVLASSSLNRNDISILLDKIKGVAPDLHKAFIKHFNAKYIIVFPKEIFRDFKQSISAGIKNAITQYKLELDHQTIFSSVDNKVNDWESTHKSFYNNFLTKLDNYDLNINEFLKRINNYDKQAYQIFEDIYPHIMGGEKYHPVNSASSITEIMEDFETSVINKKYSGVIYLFDELGRYLERNIEAIDVKEIQDAAEFCNSGSNSALFCITHKDIFQYAKKLRNSEHRSEWEKVSGRFIKEDLTFEESNINEILRVILKKNEAYKEFKISFTNSFNEQKKLIDHLDIGSNDVSTIIDDLYPLNYVFANILSGLSQKLAQNERTMFSFLCGNESKSLRNIFYNSSDKIDFLSIDKLYDYFEENFKYLQKKQYQIYLSSKSILNKLDSLQSREKRLIKAIALINIFDNYSLIPPKIEYISAGLTMAENEVLKDCNYLKELGYISNRGIDGKEYYRVVNDIDINVNREVLKYINQSLSDFNYIDTLMNHIPPGYIYPVIYNNIYHITRYIKRYYVDSADVSIIDKNVLKDKIEDGKIVYFLNLTEKNYDIKEISKSYGNSIIFIHNKNNKLDLLEDIKELESVHRLIKTRSDIINNEVVFAEFTEFEEETKVLLDKQLSSFFSFSTDIEIIINGQKINCISEGDFQKLLTIHLEKKYRKFVPLNYELINKTKLTATMKKCRREVLKVVSDRTINMEYFKKTGAENSIARVLLKNTKIWDKNCVDFKGTSYKEFYLDFIEFIKGEPKSLDDLYMRYTSSTSIWGFRRALFTFLLALIIENHCEEIYISLNGDEVSIVPELFDRFDMKTSGYFINYIDYTDSRRDFIKELYAKLRDTVDNNIFEKNQSLAILHGLRLFIYAQPKLVLLELSNNIIIKKLLQYLATNDSKEFFFKKIPKLYPESEEFSQITKELIKTITLIEGNTKKLRNGLSKIIKEKIKSEECLSLKDSLAFWYDSLPSKLSNRQNNTSKLDSVIALIYSMDGYEGDLLSTITEIINGFDFYKWRSRDDISLFSKELDYIFSGFDKKFDKSQKTISKAGNVKLSPLGNLLKGKLNADIKNMGQSITPEELKNILANIIEEL